MHIAESSDYHSLTVNGLDTRQYIRILVQISIKIIVVEFVYDAVKIVAYTPLIAHALGTDCVAEQFCRTEGKTTE